MTRVQRVILIAAAGAIVGMFLFPPFVLDGGDRGVHDLSYGFLLADQYGDRTVHLSLLLFQFAGLAAVGGLLWAAFPRDDP